LHANRRTRLVANDGGVDLLAAAERIDRDHRDRLLSVAQRDVGAERSTRLDGNRLPLYEDAAARFDFSADRDSVLAGGALLRPTHREEHPPQRRRSIFWLAARDAAHGSGLHLDLLVVRGQVDGPGYRGDGDDSTSVRGDEEVAALAVRARVAAFHLDVQRSLPRLDFRLHRAAHLGAQPAIVRVLEPYRGGLVHAHLHAVDADFRLADLGTQGVARRESIADLRIGPSALRPA